MRSVLRSDSLRLKSLMEVRSSTTSSASSRAPGIAGDRGDGCGLAGDLGLLPERLELAAHLRSDIRQTGEVRFEGLELAERLLLAAAVLEDAGGLLDEAAALLGARVQHLVELALADDHVHLTAEAGVAEQLLHIQQAALLAVDRVLAGRRCGTACD